MGNQHPELQFCTLHVSASSRQHGDVPVVSFLSLQRSAATQPSEHQPKVSEVIPHRCHSQRLIGKAASWVTLVTRRDLPTQGHLLRCVVGPSTANICLYWQSLQQLQQQLPLKLLQTQPLLLLLLLLLRAQGLVVAVVHAWVAMVVVAVAVVVVVVVAVRAAAL
jgi:hypothetical protein